VLASLVKTMLKQSSLHHFYINSIFYSLFKNISLQKRAVFSLAVVIVIPHSDLEETLKSKHRQTYQSYSELFQSPIVLTKLQGSRITNFVKAELFIQAFFSSKLTDSLTK